MIVGHRVPAAVEGYFRAQEVGALVRGRFVYRDPFGARLETGFELVPGEGGEPLPGNNVGNNYYRPYTRDDPDAPHRRYGA